jgi:TonB family protein
LRPKYPELAKQAKAQGKVEVRILVNRNEDVDDACIVEGHPLLAPAAKSAALQWQFKKNFGLTHEQKRRYMQAPLFFIFRL